MGNDALKAGLRHKKKFYLRQAIEQYGKGLDVMVSPPPVLALRCRSLRHSNPLRSNERSSHQLANVGMPSSGQPARQPNACKQESFAAHRPQCEDAALNSVLCSNRAHVNLLLGNFRNAYQDGLAALRHNDKNIKVGAGCGNSGGGGWRACCSCPSCWVGLASAWTSSSQGLGEFS